MQLVAGLSYKISPKVKAALRRLSPSRCRLRLWLRRFELTGRTDGRKDFFFYLDVHAV